ncbi:GNAT family N-acetyltransferase [Nocardioides sp. zg-ZUI104]|uniref:GNAT family N-acetyltransferase n=1 Tax=Nocardioides faecalis TaxID=2803858 RepID=UPI001BCA8AC7|nr:GNAT family N-acetyltransferase [Nocardioides faecalis]MBS4753635.1 GNAT family N-acetyltransferase [Nocardioides faecalis]
MQIRPAVPDDAPAIAPLLAQLGYPTAPDALAQRLERAAASDVDATWVAVAEGPPAVIGFAAGHRFSPVELDAPVSELTTIVVDQGVRRSGAGRALVTAYEDWSLAAGCIRMSLGTAFFRTDAHRFYEDLGYEQLARKYEKNIPH